MTKRELKKLDKLTPHLPHCVSNIPYRDVLMYMDVLNAISDDMLWAWWRRLFTNAKVEILELTNDVIDEYPNFKRICVMTKADIKAAKYLGHMKE